MSNLFQEAQSLFEYTQSMRRDFHRHPELGFQEFRTAGIVAGELQKLGLEVSTGVAKTGVVAMLEGAKPGKVVMLRFDMDALPILEANQTEYTSQNPGVMHACGHDGHTAVGLTVARLLLKHRSELHGSVKLVFQPAEEGQGGAQSMVAEGVLENPKVDACFGAHVWNEQPVGWMAVAEGPVMAGSEIFTIKLTGRGGHGALPNRTIDPVQAAAQIVTALQTIVSRNVSPFQSAVVSVTTLKAGDAFNIIPQTAEINGTIRTFEKEVRDLVLARLTQIVEGIATAMGCQVEITLKRLTPAVVNNPALARRSAELARMLQPELEITNEFRSMVSEDMAYFMDIVPGLFIIVGSANAEKGLNFSHHHPQFDIDEKALVTTAAMLTAAAIDFLKE
jgi:amidohydrolase